MISRLLTNTLFSASSARKAAHEIPAEAFVRYSASAGICSQELMDGFIVDIFFDVSADKRAEGFRGEKVNLVAEQVFEKEAEFYEVVVAFLPGGELYDQVDVAFLALLSPRIRTEEPTRLTPCAMRTSSCWRIRAITSLRVIERPSSTRPHPPTKNKPVGIMPKSPSKSSHYLSHG